MENINEPLPEARIIVVLRELDQYYQNVLATLMTANISANEKDRKAHDKLQILIRKVRYLQQNMALTYV